jgi:hypothetical protein
MYDVPGRSVMSVGICRGEGEILVVETHDGRWQAMNATSSDSLSLLHFSRELGLGPAREDK